MNAGSVLVGATSGWVRVVPGAPFLATVLLFCVSARLYPHLGDPTTLLPVRGSNILNQISVVAFAVCLVIYASARGLRQFEVFFSWPLLVIATVASSDPPLSARRYVLVLLVFSVAGMTLVLPHHHSEFAFLLAAFSVAVLLFCAGVLLLPNCAVHQIKDLFEPQHRRGSIFALFGLRFEGPRLLVTEATRATARATVRSVS